MRSFSILFLLLSTVLFGCASCEKLLVVGKVVCPDGRAPDQAEVQLWDLDGDADDKGGSAMTDAEGNFKLEGEVSDWFSRPEPYLKLSGDCGGRVVIEQIHGLPCEVKPDGERMEVRAYTLVQLMLDGKDVPAPTSC